MTKEKRHQIYLPVVENSRVEDAVANGKAAVVLKDDRAAFRPPLKTIPEEAQEAEDRTKATVEPDRQIVLRPAPNPTMRQP